MVSCLLYILIFSGCLYAEDGSQELGPKRVDLSYLVVS